MIARTSICTFVLLCSTTWAASPAAIGIISARGYFSVEGSRIWGNATLFDGAKVETGTVSHMDDVPMEPVVIISARRVDSKTP